MGGNPPAAAASPTLLDFDSFQPLPSTARSRSPPQHPWGDAAAALAATASFPLPPPAVLALDLSVRRPATARARLTEAARIRQDRTAAAEARRAAAAGGRDAALAKYNAALDAPRRKQQRLWLTVIQVWRQASGGGAQAGRAPALSRTRRSSARRSCWTARCRFDKGWGEGASLRTATPPLLLGRNCRPSASRASAETSSATSRRPRRRSSTRGRCGGWEWGVSVGRAAQGSEGRAGCGG